MKKTDYMVQSDVVFYSLIQKYLNLPLETKFSKFHMKKKNMINKQTL